MLNGTGDGLFDPERLIHREEATAIVFRLLAGPGIKEADATAELAPGTYYDE
ncbi:hypothetical protein [Paenibacillus germinis]|uniref:hypothetical protein n=1 Tax=Paenibacillus germinis TaxID=2654979 RepID=UPI00149236EE|nr:hypothetical protein [Paenibacillus germinis]